VHVHVNEPGRITWEGFDTATKAAAAGGITTIIDMPLNASPVTINTKNFKRKLESTKDQLHVNCGFYGGLVPGNEMEIEGMIEAGVLGIKAFLTHSGIDEFPNVGKQELEKVMPLLAQYQIPLLVHCELTDEKRHSDPDTHPESYQQYLASRPKSWENDAIAMMIDLCRKYNCPVHIVHVSSAEALSLIKAAKKEGLPLSAETCPHYIFFHSEEIMDGNCTFKCAPPIRERSNNTELKEALKNGTLDFIASDHSPAPPDLKELSTGNLQKAWGGIAGLQFLLSASWSSIKDIISIEKFIPLLTSHPADFLKINNRKGYIKPGYDADIVVWSPEKSFIVTEESIFHKHKISPYVSRELSGKIEYSFVNGELVFSNHSINIKNAGKWVLRK
ncbi:MAG: allantoinase AllB, partial [Flavisolibacter sp.]